MTIPPLHCVRLIADRFNPNSSQASGWIEVNSEKFAEMYCREHLLNPGFLPPARFTAGYIQGWRILDESDIAEWDRHTRAMWSAHQAQFQTLRAIAA